MCISRLLDILRNPIHLLNLHFLSNSLQNFFAMRLHIAKKFCKKLTEKSSNFSNKAGYARCLFLFLLLLCGCSSGPSRYPFKIGIDSNWYPLDFKAQESYINGFVEEFLLSISKQNGINFNRITANWDTLYDGLKKGQYQAVLTSLPPYDFNLAEYDFSHNFLDIGPVLIVPIHSSNKHLNKMGGASIGIITGDPALLILQKYGDLIIRN